MGDPIQLLDPALGETRVRSVDAERAGHARLEGPLGALPPRGGRRVPWGALVVATLGLAGWLAAVGWYLRSVEQPMVVPGVRAGGHDVGGTPLDGLEARIASALDGELDRPIVLTVGDERVRATRRDAGFVVDAAAVAEPLRRAGRTGNPLVDLRERRLARRGGVDAPARFALDRARAVEFLSDVKELVDRAPVDAKLDLERHTVAPERDGVVLALYETAARLEQAALDGQDAVDAAVVRTPARVRRGDLPGVAIDAVLATWETRYSTHALDSDRTFNLKVGAGKLDGHMLMPGELFSFNRVVGPRTEKEGYRVAPVISAGELIDGLAGGMCQIASTLHAAALFAGLDIVSAHPHSRPSTYIPMGLDSTVVWPSTDLKIRNPYDFPIVIHFQVNQGAVKVELLGRERPVRVVYEREIVKETGFPTETRRDPEAPSVQKYTAQVGYPGYAGQKRRYVFAPGTKLPPNLGTNTTTLAVWLEAHPGVKPLRVDQWPFHYPATSQIEVLGAGEPKMKKKPPPPLHAIPPVRPDAKPIGRIVR